MRSWGLLPWRRQFGYGNPLSTLSTIGRGSSGTFARPSSDTIIFSEKVSAGSDSERRKMKLKLQGGAKGPRRLWLHVSAEQEEGRSLLERHLAQRDARTGEWTNRMVEPERRGHSRDRWWLRNQVLVELWQETLGDDAYLAFCGAVQIDLQQWRAARPDTGTRWYRINGPKTKRTAWTGSENEFSESKPSFEADELYLKLQMPRPPAAISTSTPVVSAAMNSQSQQLKAPTVQPGVFQFVIPNKPVRCSRKLQSIRVGEILHQGKIEYLRDFLPTTLYSRVSASKEEDAHGLDKGLCLLQMSCQYAFHCTEQLDSNARLLHKQRTMQAERIQRLRNQNAQMRERRRNLQRELHALDSSQAGLRAMLEELDPKCLVRYQNLLDEGSAEQEAGAP